MIQLTAKRASKSDPIKSFTYRASEIREKLGLIISKGDVLVATYQDNSQVVLNESRKASTVYSGSRSKHVKFETPSKPGQEVIHTLKSLIKLKI